MYIDYIPALYTLYGFERRVCFREKSWSRSVLTEDSSGRGLWYYAGYGFTQNPILNIKCPATAIGVETRNLVCHRSPRDPQRHHDGSRSVSRRSGARDGSSSIPPFPSIDSRLAFYGSQGGQPQGEPETSKPLNFTTHPKSLKPQTPKPQAASS